MISTRPLKIAALSAALLGAALLAWWSEQPRRGRRAPRLARASVTSGHARIAESQRGLAAKKPPDAPAEKACESAPSPTSNAAPLKPREGAGPGSAATTATKEGSPPGRADAALAYALGDTTRGNEAPRAWAPRTRGAAGAARTLAGREAVTSGAFALSAGAGPTFAGAGASAAWGAAAAARGASRGPAATLRRAAVSMESGPLYFTGAFDGSQRFGMWAETLRFARAAERRHKKAIHFTYFINACYYDTAIEGSLIGEAQSAAEVLVRRALTQQAINEGHEIASHTARHRDGSAWTADEWRRELADFHAIADAALFQPIRDEDGEPVFPRFRPAPGATAGAVGAACDGGAGGADCASGRCLEVTADRRFCTQACNQANPCPAGTACGTPEFSDDADVCVPVPEYPIDYMGAELFDAEGRPNRSRPELKTYRAVGFRAPFLGVNDALVAALLELGYAYDASYVLDPGPPLTLGLRGDPRSLFELGLTQQPGGRAIPMDFNYFRAGVGGDRMEIDYRQGLLYAYGPGRRSPWNVGHHFALWRGGEYLRAMQGAFEFAAEGCPDDRGARRCPNVEFPSFRELAEILAAREKGRARPPEEEEEGREDREPAIQPRARARAEEPTEPH